MVSCLSPAAAASADPPPLLPARHSALNRLVTEACGRHQREPSKLIWQSHAGTLRRQVRGADPGDALHALSYWLGAAWQTLSAQTAPTLTLTAGALKRSAWETAEWQKIVDFARHAAGELRHQTTLSPARITALLNKVFMLRVARARETLAIPQEGP